VRRVGASEERPVDVRVIAATNRNLRERAEQGAFREDLYYRLADITIRLPPLRERAEDVPLLAGFLLEQVAREHDQPQKRLTPAAVRRLVDYNWPGNVRELGSILKSAFVLSEGEEIDADDLNVNVATHRSTDARPSFLPPPPEKSEVEVVYDRIRGSGISLFDMRRELEKGCIARALEEAGGNITRAAALLGMKRPRLSQLVREYGLAKASAAGDTSE
jgi:DNA-binding NtrC family response regulator